MANLENLKKVLGSKARPETKRNAIAAARENGSLSHDRAGEIKKDAEKAASRAKGYANHENDRRNGFRGKASEVIGAVRGSKKNTNSKSTDTAINQWETREGVRKNAALHGDNRSANEISRMFAKKHSGRN